MNGYVYLITEENDDNLYKIGMTKKYNIEDRMKELQTGNGNKLQLVNFFKSQYPYKVEQMLHQHYKSSHENGEWFRLDEEQINEFISECQKSEDICVCLQDNPFFNKTKKSKYY